MMLVHGHRLDTPLVRLQCYEGIDAAEALYEWNHPRQLLGIRLAEARHAPLAEDDLFGADYLLRRPLLQAIEDDVEPDDVDRGVCNPWIERFRILTFGLREVDQACCAVSLKTF